jgi:hypothetical protein
MNLIRRMALAVAVVGAAGTALADSPGDAWVAAKGLLPATPYIVVGVNLATVKSSTIYQQLFPQLLARAGDAKDGLAKVKTTCGIDVVATVQGGVVAVDETQRGAVYLSTKGLDSGKVTDCLSKMVAKEKDGKKVAATKPDAQGIVEYTSEGDDKKLYLGFLGKGVIVVATDAQDKSLLQKWLTGKGATAGTPTAKALGAVNTGAAFWIVAAQEKDLAPQVNATMKAVYGQADVAAGNINADFRVMVANPKQATDLAAFANKQVDDAKKAGQLPAEAMSVMKTLKIAPTGEEVQLKASIPEKDALTLISGAMAGAGGGAAPPN